MKELNRVVIDSDGSPLTTTIQLDGKELRGVVSLSVQMDIDGPPVVTITLRAKVHVDALADTGTVDMEEVPF